VSVTINKHFNAFSPFSDASNDEERAKVMRLKYPRACSNLEAGAEAFADMVQEVRQYEAWKFIGFDTFEEFCSAKLGKTIVEVEEIVEGVRILGGNPTVEEAKKASQKRKEIEAALRATPEASSLEIAEQTGTTKRYVNKVKGGNKTKVTKKQFPPSPQPTIKLAKDPALTAKNIKAKMGEEYAARLKEEL
jgi:hypothetical protein